MEIFFALGFVVLWIALQAWILPYFGVSTCMSGCCRPSSADQRPQVITEEPVLPYTPAGESEQAGSSASRPPRHGE